MVESTDKPTLHSFVASHATPEATVYTDDALVYESLPNPHEAVNHSALEYVRGDVHQRHGVLLVNAETGAQGHLSQDEPEAP